MLVLITFKQCCIPESGLTPCRVGPGLGANSFFMLKKGMGLEYSPVHVSVCVCETLALYAPGLVP